MTVVENRVAIAGAGPVGLTAALALARAGVPVTVFEAGPTASTASCASTFHPPTLDILEQLEVVDPLLAIGLVAPTFQFRDWDSGPIAELDLGTLAGDTNHPFRLQCEQQVLTGILLDVLTNGRLDVELCFNSPVTGLASRADGTDVDLGEAGVLGTRAFRLLVGADGAHSSVRSAAGIEFVGLTYPERYLVASTPFDMRMVLPDLAFVNYVTGLDRWCAVLSTHRVWRVLLPVDLEASTESVLDPDAVQARMQELAPKTEPYPLDDTIVYFIHQRLASTMRAEGVVLAGDAAHLNNPIGGLGMNSGIHDAYFLAKAVLAWWQGGEASATLAAYAAVRHDVCDAFVNRQGDTNWSALRENDPGARQALHEQWRATAADPDRSRAFLLRSSMIASIRNTADRLQLD